MDAEKVITELKNRYPGCPIICIPEHHPREIICEIGKLLDQGTAVAVIDQSKPHFHRKTTEVYVVDSGSLKVYHGARVVILKSGDVLVIRPGVLHSAEGDSTWVKVISLPAWTPEDHILA